MNAGDLKERILIERQTTQRDAAGQVVKGWATVLATWAAVEPLDGQDYIAAGAMQNSVTTRFKLRYRHGIKAADRITHRGLIYNINSVIDSKSAKRELVLMCKAV